jgi:AbrB family looped-hinge helix DNA binding protein
MSFKVTLDGSSRILLPKALRDELHLSPGDTLELTVKGDEVVLRPTRNTPRLERESGVWVLRTRKPLRAEETEKTLRKIRARRERPRLSR